MPAAIELEGQTPASMPVPEPEESESEPEPESESEGLEEEFDSEEPEEFQQGFEEPEGFEHDPMAPVTAEDDPWFVGDEELASTSLLTAVMPELAEPATAPGPTMPETGGATLVVRSVAETDVAQGQPAIGTVDPGASVSLRFPAAQRQPRRRQLRPGGCRAARWLGRGGAGDGLPRPVRLRRHQ